MTDRRRSSRPDSSRPHSSTRSPDPLDASHPLIVFDGVCVLCSAFVRMVIRLDRHNRFRFATAQSPFGQALFTEHGLRTDSYETSLVLVGGVGFKQLDGFIAVMSELGWPWRAATLLLLLPRPRRDWLYRRIAANRYALFGRKDSCDLPSAALSERLLG